MEHFSPRFAPRPSGIFRRLAFALSIVIGGLHGGSALAQPRGVA